MATSDAILERMMTFHPKVIDLTLDRTHRLLAALGNPERSLPPVVHIAGTNGKGSTQAMIRAGLEVGGASVHAYTSPHLAWFHERIRLAGKIISEAALTDLLDECVQKNGAGEITFFEITTCAALLAFARTPADYTLLEVGLGGRLDATNVVDHPALTIITPVSIDHQQYLGETLGEIALEKAGIIKTGVPVVSAPQQPAAAEVLGKTAAERGSKIRFVSEPCLHPLALAGAHQKWNAALAVETLRASGLGISDAAIREGLLRTEWPARFQRIGERFVVDGAHNAHSADALVQTWREVFADQRATIVFGALADKNYSEILSRLEPIAERFVFVPVENSRSESPAMLAPLVHCSWQIHLSLEPALRAALDFSEPVLLTGSLFLAGEALRIFEQNPALRACDASTLR